MLVLEQKWTKALPSDEFFTSLNYHTLLCRDGDQILNLIFEYDGARIVAPLVRNGTRLFSIYGYPQIYTENISSIALDNFERELQDFCLKENITEVTIRINPFDYTPPEILARAEKIRDLVYVNLTSSADTYLQTQVHPKHRNMISKAQRVGITSRIEGLTHENILVFRVLYEKTMRRQNASRLYYFEDNFYEQLQFLSENGFFSIARNSENQILSISLFLHSSVRAAYFLSASDEMAFDSGANNLLMLNSISHLRNLGIKILNLGGGITSSTSDSLFKYKERFSKNIVPFYQFKYTPKKAAV